MMEQQDTTARLLCGGSFSNVTMRDSRLLDRLRQVVSSIEKNPKLSFPDIFQNKAELDGFYRLMNNDRVDSSSIVQSVCNYSVFSASSESLVIAIHDTTEFSFSATTPIEGLGRLTGKKKGFYGHFCLGATINRDVVGLLGLITWTRTGESQGKRKDKRKKGFKKESLQESLDKTKWRKLVHEVHQNLQDHPQVIHVADREADCYASFCEFLDDNIRFVFRSKYNRNIKDENYSKLFDSVREPAAVCEREVVVSARKQAKFPYDRKTRPERKKRKAKLGISSKTLELKTHGDVPPEYPESIRLNFVRVFELDSPEGEAPIEWILTTNEPVETLEDLIRIVDIYRARWTIEEYFKALKTGCKFGERQFESLPALLRCLAILAPIACQLYNLKMQGRDHPEKSSKGIATSIQIKILAQKTNRTETQLSTMREFMTAIAALGGHLKHNGFPGWQVLGRGYEKLLQLEQGYLLALDTLKQIPNYRPPAICEES